MCYIIFTTSSGVFYVVLVMQGVASPLRWFQGVISPLCGGLGEAPPIIFFLGKCVTFFPCFLCCFDFHVHCWAVFRHMVFSDGFLFMIKEYRVVD
jgi:hypothetical protein